MDISARQAVQNLENTRARLDDLRGQMQTSINKAIPPEVRGAIADIESEFEPQIASAEAAYSKAEADAKAAVIQHGKTVKGQFLQVVWSKPRITWNAAALDGYALNHPELFAFRTEGNPSASVRALK